MDSTASWQEMLKATVRQDMRTAVLWHKLAERMRLEFPTQEQAALYRELIEHVILEAFPEEDIVVYNLVIKPAPGVAAHRHYLRVKSVLMHMTRNC